MEIIFIRHGEPGWSVDGWSQPDPHLTERGHLQAELSAERLSIAERPVNEIIVSPALRAQETAAPIATRLGLSPVTLDDVVEIKMPDWSGQLEETVQGIFMDAKHRSPDEWWDGIPGGETFRDFHTRVTGAFDALLAARGIVRDPERAHLWKVADEERRVAIVAHGGTNAVAIGHLLGVDPTPWEWERFILYHASFARVRAIPLAGGHVFSLRTFNDREHLPPDLRTR